MPAKSKEVRTSTILMSEYVCFSSCNAWFLAPPTKMNTEFLDCPYCGDKASLNDEVVVHINHNERDVK